MTIGLNLACAVYQIWLHYCSSTALGMCILVRLRTGAAAQCDSPTYCCIALLLLMPDRCWYMLSLLQSLDLRLFTLANVCKAVSFLAFYFNMHHLQKKALEVLMVLHNRLLWEHLGALFISLLWTWRKLHALPSPHHQQSLKPPVTEIPNIWQLHVASTSGKDMGEKLLTFTFISWGVCSVVHLTCEGMAQW